MTSLIVDNLIALRILHLLVKPFVDTDAYRLGVIDAHGKNLRKYNKLNTDEERKSYTFLHRLVFNIKKILGKLPGGDSKLKNMVAAFWLVKEYYESNNKTTSLMEGKYLRILEKLDSGVHLVEEEIFIKQFLEEEGAGGIGDGGGLLASMPANKTGSLVSTDNHPQPLRKKAKGILRRAAPLLLTRNKDGKK